MSGNKARIYFCVYFQQGPTGTQGNPRVFHCGLWVEDKNSRGGGHYFHVQFHTPYPNRPDYPVGWVYDSSVTRGRQANWKESGSLIGRILLGKLPPGIGAAQVHQVCGGVALPNNHEDCWDWTGRAITAIQQQRWLAAHAWAGQRGFRNSAYQQACTWWTGDRGRLPRKAHSWDIYGTDSSHCVVM
ncbi:hypothetical protein Daus18300_011218 [Diaporthe australafricana]|uniref:UBC core domain-containing protein n=1 Tax=Diaporthe australafricana TaxID=127596 RepID=A0ABR3W7C7_9PEZI